MASKGKSSADNRNLGERSVEDFMAHIGAKVPPAKPQPKVSPPPTATPRRAEQQAEFRSQLKHYLGKVPVDKEQEVKGTPVSVPNPFKNLDHFRPDESFDLHQMTVERALSAVRGGITAMRYRHITTAVIITGKGLHSPNGPVVKDAVLNLLRNHPDVRRFQEAPARWGGSGALLVELKPE